MLPLWRQVYLPQPLAAKIARRTIRCAGETRGRRIGGVAWPRAERRQCKRIVHNMCEKLQNGVAHLSPAICILNTADQRAARAAIYVQSGKHNVDMIIHSLPLDAGREGGKLPLPTSANRGAASVWNDLAKNAGGARLSDICRLGIQFSLAISGSFGLFQKRGTLAVP